jgi:DNA-binding NarL/FixJ family response regulator
VIRVLVVDDHAVVRRGITSLLMAAEDLECVGAVGDGEAALELVDRLDPDVLLLDLSMPGQSGVSVIRALRGQGNPVPVLVLTSFGEPDLVLAALMAGADGYLLKYQDGESILDALRCIVAGGAPVDPMVTTAVLADLRDRGQGDLLTDREKQVLELVRQGHPNKVIARRLKISEGTVKTHVTHILQRIGAADRTQAALWAERHVPPAAFPHRTPG